MALILESDSSISVNNSTDTPLSSGAIFTGIGDKTSAAHVGVMLKTDNTGILYFDFSNDNVNWDSTYPVNGFKVAANVSEFHTAIKLGRYFRVRLVNDSGAQSFLRLTTYFGNYFLPSIAPLNQQASLDQDAIFTRGTIPQDEIRIGRRAGVDGFTKFAYRSGLTSTAGEQVIWTASDNNFTPMKAADTYDISYDGTAGGSTDGAGTTGAQSLAITHINSDGALETFTHTLGTDGTDTTTERGLGINRVSVVSSGSANSNVSDITITDTTNGDTQAHIAAGDSVTQQAIFVTGGDHDGVAKWLYVNVAKISSGGDVRALIKGYAYNRLVDTKYLIFRSIIDTRSNTEINLTDPVGFNFSPSDVIWFTIDTDTNNSEVDLRLSLNHYKRI